MNKPATQADQIISAMQKLGGIATLSKLYGVFQNSGEWKTKTPTASVRRVVQTDKRIRKIKAGLYCLHDMQTYICPNCGHDRFMTINQTLDFFKMENGKLHFVASDGEDNDSAKELLCEDCGETMPPLMDIFPIQ